VRNIIRIVEGSERSTPSSFARMFDGRRVFRFCGILLVVEIALFVFLTAGTYGLIVPLPKPTSTDFVSFYAAGTLADAGTPELAYNRDAHYAAEERATKPGIVYNFFPAYHRASANLRRRYGIGGVAVAAMASRS